MLGLDFDTRVVWLFPLYILSLYIFEKRKRRTMQYLYTIESLLSQFMSPISKRNLIVLVFRKEPKTKTQIFFLKIRNRTNLQ